MIDNLYLYKSVNKAKENYPPILVKVSVETFEGYLSMCRVLDNSTHRGNARGLLGLLAYSPLTKWSDEE